MRIGRVVGTVTLSRSVPSLAGGRFLVVTPYTREHTQKGRTLPDGLSREPSCVVYDNIGAGVGDGVGWEEGREAAMPFDEPTPVDAFNAAILDEIDRR
jgi:ethanolamine utilization protein EutN